MTASMIANGLTALGMGFRVRATSYSGLTNSGTLTSVALDLTPRGAWQASVNGGVRTSTIPGAATTRLTWTGADLDLSVTRSLYLLLSYYRETGSPSATRQIYWALSWRF